MQPIVDPIRAISVHGQANAAFRERIIEFIKRSNYPYKPISYFGMNRSGAQQFAKYPHRAISGEYRLRSLARGRSKRIVLSREASPLSAGGIEERLLRATDHAVYDIDDALFHDARGPIVEPFLSKRTKSKRAAQAADVILAGNDYIADWASNYSDDVRVIPTCIDPCAYMAKVNYEIYDPPRLVWLGTFSGERFLQWIEPALTRINRDTGATLTIIGDTRPKLGSLESFINRLPWSIELARGALREYDLGLMPLQDTPFTRGKCAYKLLEYGAAGLPAIASPVGVNARILADAGSPSPPSPSDWYEAMHSQLTMSAVDRKATASNLRSVVVHHFSFDEWLPAWQTAVTG